MRDLSARAIAEEQMDAADLPAETYAALLADLARVNGWTMAARPTLAFLDRAIPWGGTLKLLDVGFGHGDMLRRIARWAARRGVTARLVGIDLNPRSAEVASSVTDPLLPIRFRAGDYADCAGEGWDVVTSSLVAHHMDHGQLIAFLRFMEAEAARGWLVNDLHRQRLPYFGFPLLARAMRWHRIVREDGTLSVARSLPTRRVGADPGGGGNHRRKGQTRLSVPAMRRTAALIVGGGPAGSAAAIGLARGGVVPLLIERDAETRDALCGGFLSWATIARLAAFGVDPFALGAHRIDRVVLFHGSRNAEARLPAPAAALSRHALDTALLAAAQAAGAGIERGVGARAFEDGVVRLDDGGTIAADMLILATGKHELRGAARPKAGTNAAIGLRWRLGASPALTRLVAGRIELHLFRGGYAGLNLQEDGGANLCLAVRPARFAEADRRPGTLLAQLGHEAPALAERIAAASAIGSAQAIANVPYGWRATVGERGLYRVGDQCGVIPSLAGEGMAIAIASGGAAADAIARGEPATRFQPRFARRLHRPVALAAALWHARRESRRRTRADWCGARRARLRDARRAADPARLSRL